MKRNSPVWFAALCLIGLLILVWSGHNVRNNNNRLNDYISSLHTGLSFLNHKHVGGSIEAKEEEIIIEETAKELIGFYCEKFGVSERLVTCIVKNESSFNHLATGDGGKAKGYAQFWIGTWKAFRKEMGLSVYDDRTDKAESIKTLVWGLATGKGSHWSVYKGCLRR